MPSKLVRETYSWYYYYAGTESLVLEVHGKTSGRYPILLMNTPGPARMVPVIALLV